MKAASVLILGLMLAAPTIAQNAPQQTYPPGYDCAGMPAGSERQACEDSQLDPKVDDPNGDSPAIGAGEQTPGTVSPPTFPEQPGGENRDSGPGTEGGAGGVGN